MSAADQDQTSMSDATPKQTANIREARRQSLMDAADVLRSWLNECCDLAHKFKHTSPTSWARSGMEDCISEIERLAYECQEQPHE